MSDFPFCSLPVSMLKILTSVAADGSINGCFVRPNYTVSLDNLVGCYISEMNGNPERLIL
jgi:hypothetical protein